MSIGLFVDNNNVAELRHLRNSITGEFLTSATVTITITDSADSEITGHTWPLAMAHDKSGTYRVTLDDEIDITSGSSYTAEVNATGSGGLKAKWVVPVIASTRTA